MYRKFIFNFFSRKNNYETISQTSLSKVFKYYFFTAFIIAVIFSLSLMFVVTGNLKTEIQNTSNSLIASFPDDLVLNFETDGLSINQPEPFAIPNIISPELPKNLITFNTSTDLKIQDLNNFDSFAVATKDSVFIKKMSEQANIDLGYESFTYKEMEIGIISVTKQVYQTSLTAFTNLIIKILPALLAFGSLFVVIMFFVFNIFISLFFAFLVVLISMLKGRQFGYQEAYKFSLFSTILALILGSFLSTLNLGFPMMNVLILIILTFILIPKNTNKPEVDESASQLDIKN